MLRFWGVTLFNLEEINAPALTFNQITAPTIKKKIPSCLVFVQLVIDSIGHFGLPCRLSL